MKKNHADLDTNSNEIVKPKQNTMTKDKSKNTLKRGPNIPKTLTFRQDSI